MLTNKIGASGGLGFGGGTLNSLGIRLVLFGPAVAHGQDYRLLSAAFIHYGILHIAVNMYVLYLLGGVFERYAGPVRFAAVYFTSALAGSFGALILSPNAATAGASGAIFGIMGALFVLERQRGMALLQSSIGGLILINLVITFGIPGISIGGHIGGLIGGALAGFALSEFGRGHMAYGKLSRALAARRRRHRSGVGRRIPRGRRMRVLRWLRRSWPAILAVLALAVAAALVWAWRTPSGYFILWPDKAHPAAAYLHIPGGKGPAAGTGFYFVDVHELEANKLEELWGRYLVHGASLIPVREVVLPGESEKQRVHEDFQAMDTSQVVAEAVAERALGRDVTIRHLGALVEDVTPGLPAAKGGIVAGDVITAVDGHVVRSAADLVRLTRRPAPRRLRRVHVRAHRDEAPAHRREHRRQAPRHHRRGGGRRRPHRPHPGQGALHDQRHRRALGGARIRPRDLRQPERPPSPATGTASPRPASSTRSAT